MEEIKLFKGLASTFQISFISTFRSEISRQFLINLLACFMRGMLKACNFTKGSTPVDVLYVIKIVQMVPNRAKHFSE